ncbi:MULTISPECIES: septal ring lytic transglycosylase RlpA family protein [Arcicella]|uniref:Probable endolytic peptidoglycan transglycosylase RlpA n=1 Tax=Arcicella lustrica TaxID=2984196 RepID=A0ABU5SQ14_9BACT|nr:septal ring lytic transglycosylase RlpA family protein [Arcicella sp. DC25W]MEA5429024.1 septal ring lytic transglycosylase RlpA family protein [Arcicella sp. DC25W]
MSKPLLGIIIIFCLFCSVSHAQKLGDESYGISSFYAQYFYQKPTSTGEILQRNQYTAAHMTLPFGTMVEVTNLANKRFVIVRINDRGPFKPGRIIDLTENPAKWLKMTNKGLTKVRLKVVGFDGDIMLEPYDSLRLVAPPHFEPKFYQKTKLKYHRYYRLKKNWQKRKYPNLKHRRLKVNSYLRRLSKQRIKAKKVAKEAQKTKIIPPKKSK